MASEQPDCRSEQRGRPPAMLHVSGHLQTSSPRLDHNCFAPESEGQRLANLPPTLLGWDIPDVRRPPRKPKIPDETKRVTGLTDAAGDSTGVTGAAFWGGGCGRLGWPTSPLDFLWTSTRPRDMHAAERASPAL
jgi:hypothetical protein